MLWAKRGCACFARLNDMVWHFASKEVPRMKRILSITIALLALSSPARAYIDHLSMFTLGYVLNQSTHVAVMQVEKVSKEKRVVIYKKIADLKGRYPSEQIKHQITDGFQPRDS